MGILMDSSILIDFERSGTDVSAYQRRNDAGGYPPKPGSTSTRGGVESPVIVREGPAR
jgi:hypothetical protein